MDARPVIAILAGGRSVRMGADKALLAVGGAGGVSILERVAGVALEVSPRVLVVGRERPEGRGGWPGRLAVTFVADDVGAEASGGRSGGPVVGLITALRYAREPVLLLACDLPLVTAELLRLVIGAHAAGNLATMAGTGGGVEPLCAVYTAGLLPILEGMLRENRRALQPLARLAGVATFVVPAEHAGELLNVNTPAEWAEAERILRQQAQQQQ